MLLGGELTLWPLLNGLVPSAPLWVAIAFAAYVVDRGKQFRVKDLLIFTAAEAIALAVAIPSFMIARE